MSIKLLDILLFSGFLIAAMVPPALQAEMDQEAPQSGPTIAFSIEDVRNVQLALRTRGYDPGVVNGMMTSETQAAIRQFQTASNLPVTGVLDERTQAELGISVKGPIDVMRAKPVAPEIRETIQTPTTPDGRMTVTDVSKSERDLTKVDRNVRDANEKIAEAAAVLHTLPGGVGKRIPAELLRDAEAVAVIPDVVRGALGMGGRYGKGVVSERLEGSTWSPPAFIQIGGGSFGAQTGVTSADLVLIFTDDTALNKLERGAGLKLGVDASIAAGPIGTSAGVGPDSSTDSDIFAYTRSQGVFAGVALDGAVLDIDDQANRSVYGPSVTARRILSGNVPVNVTVRPFINAVQMAVPTRKISEAR